MHAAGMRTSLERAMALLTSFEAAGETSAARMLLLTQIQDLIDAADAARAVAPKGDQTMSDPFFIVWNPDGARPPRFRHSTFEAAEAEARRLADANPSSTFYVLENRGVTKTLPAVFTPVRGPDCTASVGSGSYTATGVLRADCIVIDPISSLAADAAAPARVLKHGEYLPGDRVRYTGRGPGRFASRAVGHIGLFHGMGDSGFCLVDWAGVYDESPDGPTHVRNIEHESLPQFEIGDIVRLHGSGAVLVVCSGTTQSHIVAKYKSMLGGVSGKPEEFRLIRPVQHRGDVR